MAKCYFAKRKLVWEVLDGGLKNKIEIQWSHIVAIKADFPDDGPETLDVVVLNFSSFSTIFSLWLSLSQTHTNLNIVIMRGMFVFVAVG